MIYLDTHSAIWLRDGDPDAFDKKSRRALEADNEILISPMVLLEIQMLYEKRRTADPLDEIWEDLTRFAGVSVCNYPFAVVIDAALGERWTRDPFDRIITAHARARRATLITHDALIQANYELAVW